jgi:hypothetical protein
MERYVIINCCAWRQKEIFMSMELNRREWIKRAALAVAALPFVGTVLSACTKGGEPRPEGAEALSETDPTAQALGYMADGSKVDTAKFPKKAGEEGAKQNCANCAQYVSANGGWGKCNIFPGKVVAANGWCNSWVPKA